MKCTTNTSPTEHQQFIIFALTKQLARLFGLQPCLGQLSVSLSIHIQLQYQLHFQILATSLPRMSVYSYTICRFKLSVISVIRSFFCTDSLHSVHLSFTASSQHAHRYPCMGTFCIYSSQLTTFCCLHVCYCTLYVHVLANIQLQLHTEESSG